MDIWSIGSSEVNKTLEEKVDKLINATQYGEFAEILKNSTGVLVAVANISHTISSSGSHSNSVLQCVPQVFEQGIVILDHVSHLQVDCVPGKVSEDALAQLRQILTDIAPSLVPSALTIQSMNLALLPSCRQKLISHVSDIEGIFKYIPPLLENFHNAFIVCQGQSKFIASEFTRVSALLFDVLGQLQSKAPLFSTTDLHLKTLFSVLHVPFQTCLISLRLLFSLPLLETKFETVFKACAHAKEIYILATNILKTLYLLFLRNIHEPVKDDLIKSIQNAQDVCKGSPFKSCLTFNLNDKPTIYPKSTADAPNMQCASNKLAVKKTKKKTTALEHSYAKADAPNMQCVSNKPAVKKTKKKTEKRIVSSPMKKKRDLVKQISLTELKKYQAGGMSMSLRNDVKINENGSVGNMKDHGPGFESNTISNRFESSTIQTEISDVKIIGPVCNPEALCSADPDDLIKSIQNAQDVCKGSPFKSCLTFNLNDKSTIYPKSTADAPNMQCASNKLAVKKTKKKTTALEHSYAKADAPNMQCVSNKPAVKKTKKKTEKRIVSSPMKKKRDLVKQISLTELKKYQAGGMSMSLRNDVKINENGSVGNMKDHGPGFESNTISNRFESSTIQTEISDVKIIGPVCNPEVLSSADPDSGTNNPLPLSESKDRTDCIKSENMESESHLKTKDQVVDISMRNNARNNNDNLKTDGNVSVSNEEDGTPETEHSKLGNKEEEKKKKTSQVVNIAINLTSNADSKNSDGTTNSTKVPTISIESCKTVPNDCTSEIQHVSSSEEDETKQPCEIVAIKCSEEGSQCEPKANFIKRSVIHTESLDIEVNVQVIGAELLCDCKSLRDEPMSSIDSAKSSMKNTSVDPEIPSSNEVNCNTATFPSSNSSTNNLSVDSDVWSILLRHVSEVELTSLNGDRQQLLSSLITKMKPILKGFSFIVCESQLSVLCKICGLSVNAEDINQNINLIFFHHKYHKTRRTLMTQYNPSHPLYKYTKSYNRVWIRKTQQ